MDLLRKALRDIVRNSEVCAAIYCTKKRRSMIRLRLLDLYALNKSDKIFVCVVFLFGITHSADAIFRIQIRRAFLSKLSSPFQATKYAIRILTGFNFSCV